MRESDSPQQQDLLLLLLLLTNKAISDTPQAVCTSVLGPEVCVCGGGVGTGGREEQAGS